jgi:hypothetical protein
MSRWWPAVVAGVVSFVLVVVAGVVLLWPSASAAPSAVPAAAPPAAPSRSPVEPVAEQEPEGDVATSRLAVVGSRRVLDGIQLPAEAELEVPLPGVPEESSAVLATVTLRDAGAAGDVTLASGDDVTPVMRLREAGASASTTVVARLAGALRLRTAGGGRVTVTLTGAFVPASRATAGRIVPTTAAAALELRSGERGTVDPPSAEAAALLVAVTAKGAGTATVGRDHELAFPEGVSHGFLVAPVDAGGVPVSAGTRLSVSVVGYVTGPDAEEDTAGLSVPAASDPLQVTLPVDGFAEVAVPAAADARAVLSTVDAVDAGRQTPTSTGLLRLESGSVGVSGAPGAEVTLTPRLLIR